MTLQFDPEEGLVIVPTKIYGPTGDSLVRLALDTGATATMVNWDILVLLGYDPAVERDRTKMTTGSGVEFVPRIPVKRIEALGQGRTDMPVLCHTLPSSAMVDGVLGLDFFRGHRLILDLEDGCVVLE